jgi:hypothetical protein
MAEKGHERRIGANASAAGRPQTADPAGGQGGFRLGPKLASRAAKKIGRPSPAINEVAGTSPATRCAGVRPQFTGVPSGARSMISIRVPQGSVM